MASLKKNIAFQTAYKLFISVAPLITTPYLSRVLGAESLGAFSYRQSIVNFFLLFAMLGISNYGVRTIAETRKRNGDISKVFSEIYTIQLYASSSMTLCYTAYVVLFCKEEIVLSWILIFYLIGDVFDVTWFFFGTEEINITAIRGMIIKLISVFAVFVFVKTKDDVWKYAFILAGGTTAGQIMIWPPLLRRVRLYRPTHNNIVRHIKPIFVLFIPLAAISIYHIMDKIMLGIISDSANSGYYYNADKVVNIPIVVITGIHAVFFPRVSSLLASVKGMEETTTFQNEAMLVTMALTSSMAFGIAAVSDEFVPVFLGSGYEPCIQLIKVFALVMIAKSISSAMSNLYIIPTKNDSIYIISVFVGAGVNLIANLVFLYIFKLGAMGATLGTLLAEGSVALIDVVMSERRMLGMKPCRDILDAWYLVVIGVAMYVVLRMTRTSILTGLNMFVMLIIEIAIGVLFYGACVLIISRVSNRNLIKLILSSRK